MNIKIIVNDVLDSSYISEHGLSLAIETESGLILFDTGQGEALVPNAKQAGIDLSAVSKLIFSHGHYDHTGGLVPFLGQSGKPDIFFAHGLIDKRFRKLDESVVELSAKLPTKESVQSTKPTVKSIGIPDACRTALNSYPSEKKHEIGTFTQIESGIFLTGPIPRISGEDTGGAFYLDDKLTVPDTIADEQAILFADGTLVVGCCHAGIINTVRYCQQVKPEIPIRNIIGGLHLLHASQQRLEQTKNFLNSLCLESLTAIHCTGVELG